MQLGQGDLTAMERERDPHAENVFSSLMHGDGDGMISFFFEACFFFDGLVSGTTGNPIDVSW
jgi:hypothetical protein